LGQEKSVEINEISMRVSNAVESVMFELASLTPFITKVASGEAVTSTTTNG
jgi:hypothetical protein